MNQETKQTTQTNAKTVYPDGTIFYRADRTLWVAMLGGVQKAARSTVNKCRNYLENQGFQGEVVVIKPATGWPSEKKQTKSVVTESVAVSATV